MSTARKAALFDLDSTLTDHATAFSAWAEEFCVSTGIQQPWLVQAETYHADARHAFFAETKDTFGLQRSIASLHADYRRRSAELVPYRPEVCSAVQQLADNGWALGVVTNGSPDAQRLKLDVARLTEYFDSVVISGEYGVRNGYDPVRNTFTQSYGSAELDASLLLIPLVGFLPPDDKRVIGTIEAIQSELSTGDDELILRYRTAGAVTGADGLAGSEGAFLACSFWLVEALTMISRTAEATTLFETLLSLTNDVGLLAEEYDCVARRRLGNSTGLQPLRPGLRRAATGL